MAQYVIGIDLGTTAFKAGLFDSEGKTVATYSQEHDLITPDELTCEQTAAVYWDTFTACVRELLTRSGVDRDSIVSLSLSVQGETMVFLDEDNQPLCNFMVWMDRRPQQQAETINTWFSAEEILNVTGQGPVSSIYPAAKILWTRETRPDIWQKTRKILMLEDYIYYRLGGGMYGEGSVWCTSYLFDITTGQYWPEMLEKLQVTESMLPQIRESGSDLGTILPEIADELGLPRSLKLVMGALDQACGTIGAGNVRPGVFTESTGAALVVVSMIDEPVLDQGGELPCFYSAIPGMYMLHAGAKGGIMVRWLRDALCEKEMEAEAAGGPNAYDAMDRLAAEIAPGSEGLILLPYFGGAGCPNTDQYAKGMVYGLGFQHTRAHLIRCFLEGIALSIAHMVEYAEGVSSAPVTEIRSLSGGAKSPLWCQIKADVLNRPVVTMKSTQDSACLGAAMIAGVGAGIWPSIAHIADRVAEVEHVYQPNPATRAAYDSLFERYKVLVQSIQGITHKL